MSVSPILALSLLATSQANKEVTINGALDALEAMSAYFAKSAAGTGSLALTATEARHGLIEFTGALTGARVVQIPAGMTHSLCVMNSTTGAYALSVQYGAGTDVVIPPGAVVAIRYSGGAAVINDLPSGLLAEFIVYRGSTTQTISANTDEVVQLNTETLDTARAFDSASAWTFTAPVTGTYEFLGAVEVQITAAGTGDTNLEAFLRVNGTRAASGTLIQGPNAATTRQRSGVSALLRLAAGDTVDLCVRHEQTGASAVVKLGSSHSYLAGRCVRAG